MTAYTSPWIDENEYQPVEIHVPPTMTVTPPIYPDRPPPKRLLEIKDRLRRIDTPWFVRYTDDERWQPMTTISKVRAGDSDGECYDDARDAEDTVAIVFHQCSPVVEPDENDENADFIANAPDDMRWLIEQLETRL